MNPAPSTPSPASPPQPEVKEPLRLRFTLLWVVLLLVFALAIGLLKFLESFEYDDMLAQERESREQVIRQWMALTGDSLHQFASDYSQWDEMVAFSREPNAEWARYNIDASLRNFRSCGAWVHDKEGKAVYSVVQGTPAGAQLPPLDTEVLGRRFGTERQESFFSLIEGVLYEFRVAHLRGTEDFSRQGPMFGWFVVARHWGPDSLATLASLSQGAPRLHLSEAQPELQSRGAHYYVTQPLPGWTGRPVAWLVLECQSAHRSAKVEHDVMQLVVVLGFGLFSIGSMIFCLRIWVVWPLAQIGRALACGEASTITPLLRDRGEVGRLARLVVELFEQRQALRLEVQARRNAEQALRQSEASLRHAMEERATLARNLHDGAIQTLFAAGMGVGGALGQLEREPEEAARRIEQSRNMLNEVIRDLRGFIVGLEPETLRGGMAEVLGRMAGHMQGIRSFVSRIDIDPAAEAALSAEERAQLLYISREALSNALRHGHASTVVVSLSRHGDRLHFEVSDDGVGMPAAPSGQGHGLSNLRRRAADLGARLEIAPASGHGTVIRILIPLEEEA